MREETYKAAQDAIQDPLGPLKDRIRPSTILREIGDHIADKFVPHGAGEIGNVLYGPDHSAYSPSSGMGGVASEQNMTHHTEIYDTRFNESEVNVYGTPPDGWEAKLDRASDRGKPPEPDQGQER